MAKVGLQLAEVVECLGPTRTHADQKGILTGHCTECVGGVAVDLQGLECAAAVFLDEAQVGFQSDQVYPHLNVAWVIVDTGLPYCNAFFAEAPGLVVAALYL